MTSSGSQFFPLSLPSGIALLAALLILIALFESRLVEYSDEKIGIGQRYIWLILLLSFFGSFVELPVAKLSARTSDIQDMISFWRQYGVLRLAEPTMTVVVNVGGAVIPAALSLYLAHRNRIVLPSLVGTVILGLVVHALAHPIGDVGIAVPMFIPPVLAVTVAAILTERSPAALAYIIGVLGTLLGTTIMNLGALRDLGIPVASIGGAGAFDAIFLNGILAVLLTGRSGVRRKMMAHAHPAAAAQNSEECLEPRKSLPAKRAA